MTYLNLTEAYYALKADKEMGSVICDQTYTWKLKGLSKIHAEDFFTSRS